MSALSLKVAASLIEEYIAKDVAVFLHGPPGAGKSDTVKQVGAKLKLPVIDIRLSLRDPVDLRGLPFIDAKSKKTIWLPPAELPHVDVHGPKGILFLDEMNTVNQSMQAPAMGLVLDRKLGEYTLPKGWVPIAAGNRLSDKAAAQKVGTALKNRFAHIEVNVDLESWCEWAAKVELHPMVIGFLRFRPELLHNMPQGDENCFPTPRTWAMVARFADSHESIRQALVAGLVGDGPAAEFEGFARTWARLPSIKQIFEEPTIAKVPPMDEPAVYYAVSSAIARRCTKENFANAVTYAKRLPKEFEIMIVLDAARRDPALIKTRTYANWAADNSHVMI